MFYWYSFLNRHQIFGEVDYGNICFRLNIRIRWSYCSLESTSWFQLLLFLHLPLPHDICWFWSFPYDLFWQCFSLLGRLHIHYSVCIGLCFCKHDLLCDTLLNWFPWSQLHIKICLLSCSRAGGHLFHDLRLCFICGEWTNRWNFGIRAVVDIVDKHHLTLPKTQGHWVIGFQYLLAPFILLVTGFGEVCWLCGSCSLRLARDVGQRRLRSTLGSDTLSAMCNIYLVNLLKLDRRHLTIMLDHALNIRRLLILIHLLLERVSIHAGCSGVWSSLSFFVEFQLVVIGMRSCLLLVQKVAYTTDASEFHMGGSLHEVGILAIIFRCLQSFTRLWISIIPQILDPKNRRRLSFLFIWKFSVLRAVQKSHDGTLS